jgi:hypothetical protein
MEDESEFLAAMYADAEHAQKDNPVYEKENCELYDDELEEVDDIQMESGSD